jgi:CRISPR/Cas system-associated protein Cas10 (large subunit of type III CRISPR-Cas system)
MKPCSICGRKREILICQKCIKEGKELKRVGKELREFDGSERAREQDR